MNNETDVRQVMERTTTEDSAKIQEPERATGDGDAIDAEVLSLRSQLTTLTQERDALVKAIRWALGEEGTFGEEPAPLAGKYRRRFWWRSELRRRMDAALALVDQGASK
jgi:hypothetical protein